MELLTGVGKDKTSAESSLTLTSRRAQLVNSSGRARHGRTLSRGGMKRSTLAVHRSPCNFVEAVMIVCNVWPAEEQVRLLMSHQGGKIELGTIKSAREHWTMNRETLRTRKPTVPPNIRTTT